jgi:hypothetical protein
VRLSGTYPMKWRLMYSTPLVGQTGDWHGRDVQIRDANNTLVTVRVDPHVGRCDWVKIWDTACRSG